ncbi:MAG: P-type conjugative transfer protein TrbJ [Dongiaceae bacterium]
MKKANLRTRLLASVFIAAASIAVVLPASARIVFDPTNYAQNLLQAARALEQIQNQVKSLQNEAQMLTNMALNLKQLDVTSLGEITAALRRVDSLMAQAEGIAFGVQETTIVLQRQFPKEYDAATTTNEAVSDALTSWHSAMDAYRHTMTVQAQVVENVQADSATLAKLLAASDSAVGSLQAQQATNQLVALTAKQQLQIQNLMAAQYRAEALDEARKAEAERAARSATDRFLGPGHAYTPE